MALNRTKVLEAAQKFLQKGQHDKAIAEYQKLVKEDPRDVRTLLKIGDLHTRRGNKAEAIETYGRVAEQYAKQGFFLKAVAVYKQILKLDPDKLDVCIKLAAMYEELALISDALNTYEAVADGYARAGDTESSLSTMQKMVDLDPDNIAVRIKLAEALSRAERTEEAAEAFAAGAALLKNQGRIDDYLRVAERQLYHQPENVALAKELSSLYLETKDAKRALAKLQLCFKHDPRDIQTLEMLAEAFRQLGQGSKTISVLREIARIHGELGAEEPRRRALERILDLDPDDQEARQALGVAPRGRDQKFGATMIDERSPEERAQDAARRMEEANGAAAADHAADMNGEPAQSSDDDDELLMVADDDSEVILVEEDEPQLDEQAAAESEPPSREREPETVEQRVARLIAEADMQAAAGFWLEVEGLLKEALELSPHEVSARERLKDLYVQLDRPHEAVTELLLLADNESDTDRAIGFTEHAVRLAPEDPRPKLRLQALLEAVEERVQPAADDDPLEQPIRPDEFESAPPTAPPPAADDAELEALLDAPIEDDFDQPAPQAQAPEPNGRGTLADSLPRPSTVDGLLEGATSSSPPAAVQEDDVYDPLLDAPIDDDFGPAPTVAQPSTHRGVSTAALLDAPISPDEFDAGPPPKHDSQQAAPLSMLDAPIEDDFGGPPPPPASGEAALPSPSDDVDILLEAPIEDDFEASRAASTVPPESTTHPPDDFGLTDERFEQSDLLSMEPPARHVPPSGTDAASAEPLSTEEITAEGAVPGELLAQQAEDAFGAHQRETVPPPSDTHPDAAAYVDEVPLILDEPSAPGPVSTTPPPATEAEPPRGEPDVTAPPPADHQPAAAPEPVEPALNPEVEEAIGEAEFFYQQGMYDDALETVQEALLIYPDDAALQAKLAQYREAAEEQQSRETEVAAAETDETFKLAEQLAEQLGGLPEDTPGEAIDVEQVFEQFKRGVAEQVSVDDSATHFDLGIAYKEMGLVTDAMSEFRIAAQDPKRACMALTMVGMCLMEQGDAHSAIGEFHAALACEQRDARADLGLHYEIGTAYQMLGELEKALDAFQKVARQDDSFREVRTRVAELRSQLGASEDGDLDRAFDELMGDTD